MHRLRQHMITKSNMRTVPLVSTRHTPQSLDTYVRLHAMTMRTLNSPRLRISVIRPFYLVTNRLTTRRSSVCAQRFW